MEPAYKINQPQVYDLSGDQDAAVTIQSFRKIQTGGPNNISYVKDQTNNSFDSYGNDIIKQIKDSAQAFLTEEL